MAEPDSSPYRKPHLPFPPDPLQQHAMKDPLAKSKSCSYFLFKALFFSMFLVLVPLFPSQAPEFISQSIITKLWELIHLLFIGIAVSYGLFCRRNVDDQVSFDTTAHSKFDNLQHDMSRMFHFSSISEDVYEGNPCFDAQFHLGQPRIDLNSYVSENGVQNSCGYGEKSGVQGGNLTNISMSGNDFGNSCGYGEKSVVQAWNAQYLQGESMVVVAEPNCGVGELNEPRSVVDYKPLGLPVRSLRSRIRNGETGETGEVFSGNDETSFGSVDEKFGDVESRNENFGELGPRNLEEKFDEAFVASPSPISWHSRSGRRRETREKLSAVYRPSLHFRPLSVDETQFESMRTSSLRSTVSFSSNASSMSSSQGDDSPSHSVASEVMSSKLEDEGKTTSSRASSSGSSGSTSPRMKPDVRKAKSYREGSSASSSPSPPKPIDDKVSTGALHMRGHSFGSLYENDLRGAKDYLKEVRESRREDILDRKEPGPSTLNLEKKPKSASLRKASLRGKSVRTVRSSRLTTVETKNREEKQGNRIDEPVQTTFSRNEEVDGVVDGSSKQNFDTLPEYQKKEMQECSENASAKSEEHADNETQKFRLSLAEDADAEYIGNATPEYTSEVDKKAGEFIAKFREQIRLQKVASMERSRGLRLSGNYFR